MVTKYFLYREIHSRWKTWQPNNTLRLQRQKKKKLKIKYWKLDYFTSTFSTQVERRCPARWPHSYFCYFNVIREISICLFKASPAQSCQLPSCCLLRSICTSALKSALSFNTKFSFIVRTLKIGFIYTRNCLWTNGLELSKGIATLTKESVTSIWKYFSPG